MQVAVTSPFGLLGLAMLGAMLVGLLVQRAVG